MKNRQTLEKALARRDKQQQSYLIKINHHILQTKIKELRLMNNHIKIRNPLEYRKTTKLFAKCKKPLDVIYFLHDITSYITKKPLEQCKNDNMPSWYYELFPQATISDIVNSLELTIVDEHNNIVNYLCGFDVIQFLHQETKHWWLEKHFPDLNS